MSLRGFRVVVILSSVMGTVVGLFAIAQSILRLLSPTGQSFTENALVPIALAFAAIGAVAGMAGATFKAQADKIEALERRLSEAR